MKCSKCDGQGKIRNPEWLDEVDSLMDKNYPDYYMAAKQASRWHNKYIVCSHCNGTGQLKD